MKEMTVSEEFVRQSERFLIEDLLPKIKAAVALLSEEELWWRPNPQSNSVGNMLLHLSGNVRQWIISGVGQAPDRRQRDLEFVEQGPMPTQELMERLENTVAEGNRTALVALRRDMRAVRVELSRRRMALGQCEIGGYPNIGYRPPDCTYRCTKRTVVVGFVSKPAAFPL